MKKKLLSLILAFTMLILSSCSKEESGKNEEKQAALEEGTKIEETLEEKEEEKTEEQVEDPAEIDQASGLKKVGKLDLKYAKSFKVEYLENDIKKYIDKEGREVYLVPEGVSLENSDLTSISIPVNRIAIFSTVDATLLRPIDKLDTIVATTTKAESWQIPQVKERLENNEAVFLGSKNELNYEELEKVSPDVVLFTYENLDRTPVIIQQLNSLEIPWLGLSNHMENDPRARMEWVKLAGILTGQSDKAEEYYEEQLEKFAAIEEKTKDLTDRPSFAWTFMFKDLFYTKKAGDYSVKMMELAGSDPIFKDLGPNEDGNAKLSAEEFYKGAENADILIYDRISGSAIQNISDLVAYADYLNDIKAVQEDKVWTLKKNYFQSADYAAEMVEELYQIITDQDKNLTETQFFIKMTK